MPYIYSLLWDTPNGSLEMVIIAESSLQARQKAAAVAQAYGLREPGAVVYYDNIGTVKEPTQ